MHEEAGSIRWAPRVPPALITRLYEADASTIHDDVLLEDVGYRLFERCRDILIASEAMKGRATCPLCDATVDHDVRSGTWLECPCGWRMRWSAYERSFRDRWLRGGRATPFFVAFVEAWPKARGRSAKMLAIDSVLHALHVDSADDKFGRHAVASVIEATDGEGRELLDRLAGNEEWRAIDRRKFKA